MKVCYRCKTEKPETEFHKDSSRKDGLFLWCKSCAICGTDKPGIRQKVFCVDHDQATAQEHSLLAVGD